MSLKVHWSTLFYAQIRVHHLHNLLKYPFIHAAGTASYFLCSSVMVNRRMREVKNAADSRARIASLSLMDQEVSMRRGTDCNASYTT